ncbi:MAG: bifunctional aldolase/short-chain dehydrogenase [Nitrospinota bacterium]
MKNRWSDSGAAEFIKKYRQKAGKEIALRAYSSRLIGAEPALVLHGGGNTSVKSVYNNVLGQSVESVYVKASGYDLAHIVPEGFCGLDLDYIKSLRVLHKLSIEAMADEMRTHLLNAHSATPSIEGLMHAFIPKKFIDHTHADAILALTNRKGGEKAVRDALGKDVVVIDYVIPGFELAKAVADAFDESPNAKGIVLMKHGLVTWGDSGKESYEATIKLVTKAEKYLAKTKRSIKAATVSIDTAMKRYQKVAPLLRGLLAVPTGDGDRPFKRFILRPLVTKETLGIVGSKRGKGIALTPPITSDHIIRTKPLPLWIDSPQYNDEEKLKAQLAAAIDKYAKEYDAYFSKYSRKIKAGLMRLDSLPRVIFMPGLGAICAGRDVAEADVVRDITRNSLGVKTKIALSGQYESISEEHVFDMEYFSMQHAKMGFADEPPLRRSVALVTGAGGAIGTGICRELLENGCHVAVTDLPGDHLNSLVDELNLYYDERVCAVALNVTDTKSVAAGFNRVVETWGGIDLVVVNAGLAHVSSLADMDMERFQKLERVNIEGTLNVLAEAARHFRLQAAEGDIVLVSTKNVFAPGAKFGAYSATKAAAHQLARIASLELAEIGVRVNMVSPDGVFSEGARKSGLWAEVGPDRMKARGLDEKGLEDYYKNRNLLKTKITATHVAKAVMYFATRQTPTTGATIPVDGGLPDATPR